MTFLSFPCVLWPSIFISICHWNKNPDRIERRPRPWGTKGCVAGGRAEPIGELWTLRARRTSRLVYLSDSDGVLSTTRTRKSERPKRNFMSEQRNPVKDSTRTSRVDVAHLRVHDVAHRSTNQRSLSVRIGFHTWTNLWTCLSGGDERVKRKAIENSSCKGNSLIIREPFSTAHRSEIHGSITALLRCKTNYFIKQPGNFLRWSLFFIIFTTNKLTKYRFDWIINAPVEIFLRFS